MTPVLLAHQGGWDEILLVLVPIALFALLLVIANRRANSLGGGRPGDETPGGGPDRRAEEHGR